MRYTGDQSKLTDINKRQNYSCLAQAIAIGNFMKYIIKILSTLYHMLEKRVVLFWFFFYL